MKWQNVILHQGSNSGEIILIMAVSDFALLGVSYLKDKYLD